LLTLSWRIANPHEDLNELSVRWIADRDWRYTTELTVDIESLGSGSKVDLVFDGLDTFAAVLLEDIKILESDNMFLSHRVNIDSFLRDILGKKGGDTVTLTIIFASARLRGQELIKKHENEHRFLARQTEDGRIPVRKAQYHWGWDWGPILTGTSGPWRPILMEYYHARIEDLWAHSTVSTDLTTCSGVLHCILAGTTAGDRLLLTLEHENQEVVRQDVEVGSNSEVQCDFKVENPKLWFPFSHGGQDRCIISATIKRCDQVLHSQSKQIGFRNVELVQDPDSPDGGRSFYFRINGKDVFAGGSCWIPGSNYLSELKKQDYHDWVNILREGNQNMIRVWGGGIYEDEAFYNACDELGVLVWQDFAFACGNYPTYPSYRKSFENEARQNVRKLRNHPSLVIWAGNNEDYQVQERYQLHYNFADKDPESWLKSDFPARYYYEHVLPKIVETEHPEAAYHPSSPWGDGKRTADPSVGDIHQWDSKDPGTKKYAFVFLN
jgi:beta-mannosidase